MKITPKVDDAKFKRKLNQQLREQPRQVQIALGRTAEFLLGMIRKRTQKGKDADFCIIDINKPWVVKKNKLNSKSKNTPIENRNLQGQVLKTFVKGDMLYEKI